MDQLVKSVQNIFDRYAPSRREAVTWMERGRLATEKLGEFIDDEDMVRAALVLPAAFASSERGLMRAIGHDVGRPALHLVHIAQRLSMLRIISEPGFAGSGASEEQVGKATQMILNLADDFRPLLLRMVERLVTLECDEHSAGSPEHAALCAELRRIYAPVAKRLGMGELHAQIEDALFRSERPQEFRDLQDKLRRILHDSQDLQERLHTTLVTAMANQGIEGEIQMRVKSLSSVWKKMERKGVPVSQIYDLLAMRILVNTRDECFRVLNLIHDQWRMVSGEFDDYINTPKPNGYQSLHTAVFAEVDKPVEIQVRTHEMHVQAEQGVCAHWSYKQSDLPLEEKDQSHQRLDWLRRMVLDYQNTGVIAELEEDAEAQAGNLYVYTESGGIVELPAGSTALDFAYHLDDETGLRARTAIINNQSKPLHTRLSTGQVVRIVRTAKPRPRPPLIWLDPSAGFVATQRAREAIVRWFSEQTSDWRQRNGARTLKVVLDRIALAGLPRDTLLARCQSTSLRQLGEALSEGRIGIGAVLAAAEQLLEGGDGCTGLLTLTALREADLAAVFECIGNRAPGCPIAMESDERDARRRIRVEFSDLPLRDVQAMHGQLNLLMHVRSVRIKLTEPEQGGGA